MNSGIKAEILGCVVVIFATIIGASLGVIVGQYAWITLNDTPHVYEIRTCQDLQDMNKDLNGTYVLMNDIDFKECLSR